MRNTLSTRLRWIADKYHGGSVLAMSRHIGLTQRECARLVEGSIKAPKHEALHAIAIAYGTSIGWLIGETADDPNCPALTTREHRLYRHIEMARALFAELPGVSDFDRRRTEKALGQLEWRVARYALRRVKGE